MKIITYTLNEDGTIPEYIIEGGYFPVLNNNESPQDLTLIGIANDDVIAESFATIADFVQYIENSGIVFQNPMTEEFLTSQQIAEMIWNQMEAIAG